MWAGPVITPHAPDSETHPGIWGAQARPFRVPPPGQLGKGILSRLRSSADSGLIACQVQENLSAGENDAQDKQKREEAEMVLR